MENSSEWVNAVINRLSSALPHRIQNQLWTPTNKHVIEYTISAIVELSQEVFPAVISSLSALLQELNKNYPPGMAVEIELESYCTVLDCLQQCLAKHGDTSLDDDDIQALQQLYQRITHLCLLHGENTERLSLAANKVLYQLSGLHFHGIFNKIILRMTSVNRVLPYTSGNASAIAELPSSSTTTTSDHLCVIGLIPHLNLNASRLQQILQAIVTSFKDLHKRNKQLFVTIPPMLHKSIWNFIEEYPFQFNEVLNNSYPSLERSAEKLFNLCDEYADSTKKKVHIWPLQNAALILCPNTLKDITESAEKCSPTHRSQRTFVGYLQKALSSGKREKEMTEAALICAIDLFKAGSFVGDRSIAFFRYFVTLMQGQLHNLLFSPTSPFLHNSSSLQASIPTFTDRDLMMNCLVAQFRCNHLNSHIFKVCLDPNSPTVFRVAFVDAMYMVVKETSLSWWPSNKAVYLYAPQLRQIFQNAVPLLRRYENANPNLMSDIKAYLTSLSSASSLLQNKSKTERKNLVEMVTNYQLIRGLVRLFSLDPMLAFSSLKENDRVNECLIFMTSLVGLIQHQSVPSLPLRVSETLLLLHRPENIELWDQKDPMGAFWDISGQVTYSIAMKLFSRKTNNLIQLLEWLKQILHYRTQFLKGHVSEASLGTSCKILQQMYIMLETVLLLFLRNIDIDAVRVAMSCFKYLVLEAELVDASLVPYSPNIMLYQQLESLSTAPQIGRAAQQKKLRGILKGLVHTPGSALAWEDTYSSWRVTKANLITYQRSGRDDSSSSSTLEFGRDSSFPRHFMMRKNPQTGSSASLPKEPQLSGENLQTEMLNWTNMTGFLCSLAGVSTKSSPNSYSLWLMSGGANGDMCFIDGPPGDVGGLTMTAEPMAPPLSPVRDPNHIRPKRSSSYHGGRPKSMTQINPPSSRTGSTSTVVYHNSVHGTHNTHQHRGSTSSESNADAPRISQTQSFVDELMQLLRCDNEAVGVQLRETVKEMVSYELSPPVYSYLFQCMTDETLKVLTPDGQVILSDSNTAMVDQLVSIVQHVVDTSTEGALEHLVHVQMDEIVFNFIMYVDKMDTSDRSLTIKIKICHLISSLMQHHMDLNFRAEVQFRNQVAEYLAMWVRGEVVTSENLSHVETLQNDLDLSALRAMGLVMSRLVLQSKFKTSDVIEEKGKLFLKYFKCFMNLIHSMNQVQWSTLRPMHKQPLQRYCASLREYTIQAMSNMLTANIDSGLIHAIGLGYHDDLKTRISFIEVLTSILKQGAEFNSLADTALADRFNSMLELVARDTQDKGDFPIMMALTNAVPPENLDELAEVLVTLFDYKNRLAAFLTRILNTEVEALESGRVDTLFRGNSIACKVLSVSFKTFGLYYLQSVVRPLIMQLIKNTDADFEVDPTRLSDPGKLKTNQKNLLNLVKSFYSTIQESLPSLPLQLRMLCHILYSVVVTHFPDSSVDTVNSAIFLRFINPAIVSPQSYGLVQGEIPNNVRRGLTFLSKVLQNLANHVLFKKEAHMEVFNDFLCDNFECSRQLALNMASQGPYLEGEAVEYIGFLKENHKHKLHMLLWANQEKMSSYAASIRTLISSRHIFQELNTLLAQLGAPNHRRARTPAPTATCATSTRGGALISSQLEEFLDEMAIECDEKILRSIKAKDVFYQGGRSRAGHPVYYWIARKFRGDQAHTSKQLLYHAMSMLKSNTTDKVFELVIDLTQATPSNEPDLELLVKFAAYVPEMHMCQIETLYFFNTNLAFKQSANKFENMSKVFSHIKGTKRVVMVDSYPRFADHIDLTELRLPSDTVAYEEKSKTEYEVHFLMFKQLALPIPASLLVCDCGLVVSLMDRIKVFDMPIVLKEIFHISDIREVFCEDKSSLAVRMIEGGQILKFTSSKAEAIAKDISNCMSKWQNQQPSRYMSERKLEPKDVPGTFLNLALLNLGSTDSALRAAAYKLLSAAKDTFQLKIDRPMESAHDLCIPVNCSEFVVSVSTQLAKNKPHLTLEFLSEVVAGFQRYSPALKQHCLAYISPWLPNLALFSKRGEGPSEQEKLMKLIDLLVALTVSEDKMYPLIQAYVWTKIGKEVHLLKRVLQRFIKMSISDGLGSRKAEVLADTAVTLEQGEDGLVATEIIKKLLSTIAHTSNKVVSSLDNHPLWAEITVLSRFVLALSFNNKVNVVKNLADIFYFCVLLMALGPVFVRATIHGIILNTVQSLASLPEVIADDEALKEVSLKLVEFSDPKFYMQFGISSPASVSAFLQPADQGASSRHPSILDTSSKNPLSSTAVLTVTQHLMEVIQACTNLIPDCGWTRRWQRLARRTSFYYNPALQTRSFLMLGVISEQTKKMSLLVSKSLKVLEDTLYRHEEDVSLLEAIVSCLTRLVPLLDHTCEDLSIHQHLFWVAVGVLQQGEPTLYSAGLELMEACIKVFNSNCAFKGENLRDVMQITRDSMEWPLSQMDRQVGLSFASHFHFALAGLLYRGFSHSLSNVRTRALDLLTTLFFMHSPDLVSTLSLSTTPIVINKDNLAYLAALFPESESMREQLITRRWRPKQPLTPGLNGPMTPGFADSSDMNHSCNHQAGSRYSQCFGSLLSTDVITGQKDQVLFLLVLASALVQTQDEKKIDLLYQFLSNASEVFVEVFPLIHSVLVEHMQLMLQQTQNLRILKSVQSLTAIAVKRQTNTIMAIKSSYINDIGFGGLSTFFKPFPKHHPVYPTPQGALFQKYISSLTGDLLPISEQTSHPGMKGSLSKLSVASTGSSGSRDYTPVYAAAASSATPHLMGGRRISPWTSPGTALVKTTSAGGRSRESRESSRDVSPASVDNLSMDELDTVDAAEESIL